MSNEKWEHLPSDTKETCDKSKIGWSRTVDDRCGKRATRIKRTTCGCGKVDMTIRLCAEHAAEHLTASKKYGVTEPGLA